MSSRYSIERGFISKLIETGDMKLLKDMQIKPSFFTGDNRRIFQFISNSFRETGSVPTPRVLKVKFPSYSLEYHVVDGIEVVGNDETLLYWCQELRVKAKHNSMVDSVEEVAKLLDDGETDEAYSAYKKGWWKIETEIVESSSEDITKGTDDRKKAYLEKKKSGGMIGLPTGIEHLDNIMKGLVEETLSIVVAKTGIGKTWFLVLVGAYLQLQGYKVVCFITEMSTELMRDRFEAMLYGMMYGNFNYSHFKSGRLDFKTEKNYFRFLEEDLPELTPLILESVTGVSGIVSVVEREKPDIVLIDGIYLMEDEQGAKEDWLRVAHITRDLKKIAKSKHIPILGNTQASKSTAKKTGPQLDNIMYTQSIGQDADNVLSLFRDEVMYNDHEMGIGIIKQREGTLGKVVINWDFTHMNFSGIYFDTGAEQEDENDSGEENSAIIGID